MAPLAVGPVVRSTTVVGCAARELIPKNRAEKTALNPLSIHESEHCGDKGSRLLFLEFIDFSGRAAYMRIFFDRQQLVSPALFYRAYRRGSKTTQFGHYLWNSLNRRRHI